MCLYLIQMETSFIVVVKEETEKESLMNPVI